MTAVHNLLGLGLAAILFLVLGAAGGVWLASSHYRPLLDAANSDLVSTKAARDNLKGLAAEQGQKLGELAQAGKDRELAATLAQDKSEQDSQPDYAAANQLLRERTGGDPAQTAAAIIDQELGL